SRGVRSRGLEARELLFETRSCDVVCPWTAWMALPATYDRCRVTLLFNIKKGVSRRETVADDQVAACWLPLLDQQEFDAIWAAQPQTIPVSAKPRPGLQARRRY